MRFVVLAASNFTDPEHERLIWLAAGGLAVLGVLLAIATVVWWRGTKGEHAALAPLELMGDRSFATMTPVEQSRRLDAVRLQLDGDVEPSPAVAADAIDLDEALRAFQPGFDDLRDDSPEPVPAADAAAEPDVDPDVDPGVAGEPSRLDEAAEADDGPEAAADATDTATDTDGPTGRAADPLRTEAESAAGDEVEERPVSRQRNGSAPRGDSMLAGEPVER